MRDRRGPQWIYRGPLSGVVHTAKSQCVSNYKLTGLSVTIPIGNQVTEQGYMGRTKHYGKGWSRCSAQAPLMPLGLTGSGDADYKIIPSYHVYIREECRPGHCISVLRPGLPSHGPPASILVTLFFTNFLESPALSVQLFLSNPGAYNKGRRMWKVFWQKEVSRQNWQPGHLEEAEPKRESEKFREGHIDDQGQDTGRIC